MTELEMLEFAKTILQPSIMLTVVGGIISLLTSNVPGFREWYVALKPVEKSFGQVIMISIVIFIAGLLSWTGILMIVPANKFGALLLVGSWITSLMANQTTYLYTKSSQPASVMAIKEAAKS